MTAYSCFYGAAVSCSWMSFTGFTHSPHIKYIRHWLFSENAGCVDALSGRSIIQVVVGSGRLLLLVFD